MSEALDTDKLEREVKSMYRDVAESADAEFHFETGQRLAERLGSYTSLVETAGFDCMEVRENTSTSSSPTRR